MIHERLPGIAETAQDLRRRRRDQASRSRCCRPCTTTWAASRRTTTAKSVTLKDGNPDSVVPGLYGGRRGGLRLGARRQPAGLQLAARPGGVRPRGRATAAPRLIKPAQRARAGAEARLRQGAGQFRPSAQCQRRHPDRADPRGDAARHAGGRGGVPHRRDAATRACDKIDEDRASRSPTCSVSDRSLIWNTDLVETLELREPAGPGDGDHGLGARTAPKAAAPTRARTFPDRDDVNWMKHSLCWVDDERQTRLDYRPVHATVDRRRRVRPAQGEGVLEAGIGNRESGTRRMRGNQESGIGTAGSLGVWDQAIWRHQCVHQRGACSERFRNPDSRQPDR